MICAVQKQHRIVAREQGGYYVSIPVNYPDYVTVYPNDGKGELYAFLKGSHKYRS